MASCGKTLEFSKKDGMLKKILKILGDEKVHIDSVLQANLPRTSSSHYEAKLEQFQFEDLRRELVSRKLCFIKRAI